MNIFSLIAIAIAGIFYLFDVVDHATYFMCLAVYLKTE